MSYQDFRRNAQKGVCWRFLAALKPSGQLRFVVLRMRVHLQLGIVLAPQKANSSWAVLKISAMCSHCSTTHNLFGRVERPGLQIMQTAFTCEVKYEHGIMSQHWQASRSSAIASRTGRKGRGERVLQPIGHGSKPFWDPIFGIGEITTWDPIFGIGEITTWDPIFGIGEITTWDPIFGIGEITTWDPIFGIGEITTWDPIFGIGEITTRDPSFGIGEFTTHFSL